MDKIQQNENIDVDILGSIGFDLTESINDLIYNIKLIKNDVELIKAKNNSDK